MSNLPVKEMVLYKHGIGFFMRQGEVEGTQINLTFRRDEINDVLKSLAVFDRKGGQILGIDYQTPMDIPARLSSSSINLSQHATLRDLFRDLRGRECRIQHEIIIGSEVTLKGRIVGVDEVQTDERYYATLSLLTEDGVQVIDYANIRQLEIIDAQSAYDLSYFLDSSMAEDDRRVVTIRLNDGAHDLMIYYVIPAPTWRVSYRLLAESDVEDNRIGTAILQGWGLFDNRLEEDLIDVKLTLVAGQPISFIYDLYSSHIPQRRVVEDESRIAPGPISYMDMPSEELQAEATMDSMMASGAARPTMLKRASMREMAQSSPPPQAETRATGETFQYIVTTPVTVKRGDSALVPIINQEIRYERELLYNGHKFATHPVVALRFDNQTQLTLERGPVTVVEDNAYKGEAVIPFSKEDAQVYLPYAVELGIKVTEEARQERVVNGIKIEQQALFEQIAHMETVRYIIENHTNQAQTVTIEAPIHNGYELYNTREPDRTSGEMRRWRVHVEASGQAVFTRQERLLQFERREIYNLQYQRLAQYLNNKWIDDTLYQQLSNILEAVQNINNAQERQAQLDSEQQTLYERQEQLRANLGALQATGKEAHLRNRLLQQLEQSQDQLEAIERERQVLQQTIISQEELIASQLANL
ncbi:MAG: hypothetical protein ACFE0Q_09965 [Anaerolineae bacterium]